MGIERAWIHEERLLKTFTAMATLDCPAYKERLGADFVTQYLKKIGISPEEDRVGTEIHGDTGNIYAYVEGTQRGEPRLFSAHLDTVAPCLGKKLVVDGDTIRSDGKTILGADDYAAVAAILEALTVIGERQLPHVPLELLFTPGEEVYSQGANRFDYSKIKAKTAFVPDYDGEIGQAVGKAPTILSFQGVFHGKAAHAGFAPEQGVSAIDAAAKAVLSLDWGRIDGETTANVGIIEGGRATNIVPDSCFVKGEVRSYNHEKALEQMEVIRRAFAAGVDCTFSYEVCVKAYETPVDSAAVRLFQRACAAQGLPASIHNSFGGSDNNTFADKGIQGLVLASAMHRCHTKEEYSSKTELLQLTALIMELMTMCDEEAEK